MKLEINVAIYEDNKALRDSLSHLVRGSGLLRFAGAYADCRRIFENCAAKPPDVILMDIDMPYISGIEATRLIGVEEEFLRVEEYAQFGSALTVDAVAVGGAFGQSGDEAVPDVAVAGKCEAMFAVVRKQA